MPYEHRLSPDTLQLLTLSILHPEHEKIGDVTAVFVKSRYSNIFLEVMDIDEELHTIGSAIFDKYGEIRPWLVDGEYHKGSGVWGRELNDGKLFFVFCVSVEPQYREQGVASWALQQLYASEYVDKDDKFLCWPSPIPRPPSDQWVAVFDGIVDFFRKVGYRRVGATAFFAYSQDPDHPSRKKDRLDDFDPDYTFNTPGPHPRSALQDAIFADKSENIVRVIQDAHAKDPSCIHQPDSHGFRPIHIAVMSDNLHALRKLIALGLTNEDFHLRQNGDHLTPLEALSGEMRESREFQEIFKREGWQGHSDTKLQLEAMLKRAMGHPMPATDDEYMSKKKWGCTCDKCHGGWLSPRTMIRLHGEVSIRSSCDLLLDLRETDAAEVGGDTVLDDIDDVVPREAMETMFIEFNSFLSYIPLRLWRDMFKTFITGYSILFRTIAQLLSRYILPTESTVLAEAVDNFDYFENNSLKFYFNKGGRVEYALAAMADYAENDPFDLYTDDERYKKTSPCVNDREFDIVKKMIGLDPKETWGPYSASPQRQEPLWTFDSDDSEAEELKALFGKEESGGEEFDEEESEEEEDGEEASNEEESNEEEGETLGSEEDIDGS
ncbi:hypothetical protein C8F04DRAFT_949523 [Mycena alexandri]|uniref:Uncharacterized protein n=1 Tax=Mycena alexandri TaxID=1745969 RepID=A0AAD6T4A9_9AGAR|nr:hypothetical protein C8F04DRAFT_949523 [Mycena alexandri]